MKVMRLPFLALALGLAVLAVSANTASATLMVRLTETNDADGAGPGAAVINVVEFDDNDIQDDNLTDGQINFDSDDGLMFFDGTFQVFSSRPRSGLTNSLSNISQNLQSDSATTGISTLLVEVTETGFINDFLEAPSPAVFRLFKTQPSVTTGASVTGIEAVFDPDNMEFATPGGNNVGLSLTDIFGPLGPPNSGSSIATDLDLGPGPGPGMFSLTTRYLVTHDNDGSGFFSPSTVLDLTASVSAPEPASLLIWGSVSALGLCFVASRRRKKKNVAA